MQCSGDFYSHRDRYTSKSIHPATEQELKMHLFFPVHLDQASLPKTQCTQTVLTISNTGAKQQASNKLNPLKALQGQEPPLHLQCLLLSNSPGLSSLPPALPMSLHPPAASTAAPR